MTPQDVRAHLSCRAQTYEFHTASVSVPTCLSLFFILVVICPTSFPIFYTTLSFGLAKWLRFHVSNLLALCTWTPPIVTSILRDSPESWAPERHSKVPVLQFNALTLPLFSFRFPLAAVSSYLLSYQSLTLLHNYSRTYFRARTTAAGIV